MTEQLPPKFCPNCGHNLALETSSLARKRCPICSYEANKFASISSGVVVLSVIGFMAVMLLVLNGVNSKASNSPTTTSDPLGILGNERTSASSLQEADEYNSQGLECCQKGLYNDAIVYFTKAIEANPGEALYYYNRGAVYFAKGHFDNARSNYEEATKLAPNHVPALCGLGAIYLQDRLFDQAFNYFERAVNIDPRSARAHNGLGWAYFNKRQYGAAFSHFQKAIELDPNLQQAREGLNLIYEYK